MTREKIRQFSAYTRRDYRQVRRKILREVLKEEEKENPALHLLEGRVLSARSFLTETPEG